MTGPQIKPWIDAIDAYVPGRAVAEGAARTIKLSSNESPLGPSPKAIAALSADAAMLHRYPDAGSHALRDAIAAHHGIEPERVVCGTGSDELLYLLAPAYASAGDEVLYVNHGFLVYPIAARKAGATPVEAPDIDFTTDVDSLLACVTLRTRIVYLANPNNPTGTMVGRSELQRLHAALPADVLLVLDAAYAEYVDDLDYEDGIEMARRLPNVVTTRTFSKIYGLAAERIGWAYGPRDVIDVLNKTRAPFNVTTAGQAAAITALGDQAWIDKARAHNATWRDWLAAEIGSMGNWGIKAVPSSANFVLTIFPETGARTAEAANRFLTSRGYLTRWLPKQDLGNGLRITVGTEEETRGVVGVLREFLESAG